MKSNIEICSFSVFCEFGKKTFTTQGKCLCLDCYLYMDNAVGACRLALHLAVPVASAQMESQTTPQQHYQRSFLCTKAMWNMWIGKQIVNTSGYGERGKIVFGNSETRRVVGGDAQIVPCGGLQIEYNVVVVGLNIIWDLVPFQLIARKAKG